MRRLFLLPAMGFLITCPVWGIAAGHSPDSLLTAELLFIGFMQATLGFCFILLAFRRVR